MNQSHADPVARWEAVICSKGEKNTPPHLLTHTHSLPPFLAHTRPSKNDEPFSASLRTSGWSPPQKNTYTRSYSSLLVKSWPIFSIVSSSSSSIWTQQTPNNFYGHLIERRQVDGVTGEWERVSESEREKGSVWGAEEWSSAGRSVLWTHGTAYSLSCHVLFWFSIHPFIHSFSLLNSSILILLHLSAEDPESLCVLT